MSDFDRGTDLTVRCTVDVPITLSVPYDDEDVAQAVYDELPSHVDLVFVDDVRTAAGSSPAMDEQEASGHIRRLFEKVLRG